MNRLRTRVQRLERGCAFADWHRSWLRLMEEAGREVPLEPCALTALCTALDAQLQALSATLPVWLVTEAQIEAACEQTLQCLRFLLDTQVDVAQRTACYAALSAAAHREAHRRGIQA
jgi:hypothetical protein